MAGEERCELTDLIKDQCDHCRRNQKQISEQDDRPVLEDIVVAEKKGTCQVCHEDIIPGDHIGAIRGRKGRVPDKDSDTGYRITKVWVHYGCGR